MEVDIRSWQLSFASFTVISNQKQREFVEEGHKEEGDEPVDCPLLGLFRGSAAEFDGCEGVVEGHTVDDEGGEGTSQHYYYK